ncbi:MAG: geranylgeranyl reductase family protein [Bacillati bacterium ANGP1]|uniref:Geranylgeranyl reductase family protein n=1 Tax=Candidatus Segetimicrobium genomatis TaxID=2569760 RepID=A0A537IXT8_9BACT|nr:MAG: geranylgeranyl reductase family protein [Terrabacteria group bacterium ANGP1]
MFPRSAPSRPGRRGGSRVPGAYRSDCPNSRTVTRMSTSYDFDVIVVGAGPAGGMAAGTAAAMGLRTVLIEEHPEIGAPTHCSGKLQLHAFREFNLPQRLVLNTLQAGAFYAPNGAVARVRRAVPDSHVVDRAVFDRWLAHQAQERGAELLLDTRLRAAERVNGAVRVTGERSGRAFSATAALIVDAEGARPVLPKALGFQLRRRLILGLQYQMTDVDLEEPDCPEVYLGTAAAPGFFAWLMPIGDRRARVGICVDPQLAGRAPLHYLESLLQGHPVVSRRLRYARIERKLAGPIPVLASRSPTAVDGMILVGDAAGHVKATSGGGIYFSLIAARLAAESAAAYVGGDRDALIRYDRRWRRRFGRELRATTMARLALNRMTDADLNAIVATIAADERLRATIERLGDTAYQSRLLAPFMTHALRPGHLATLARPMLKIIRYGLRALWDDEIPAEENGAGEMNP